MYRTTMILAALVAPAVLAAQGSGSASGQASGRASADGRASVQAQADANISLEAPREFSAQGRARLEGMYRDAQDRELPPEPMAKRVAEGRAKGASEAAILVAVEKVKVNLEATHSALLRAGRTPSKHETAAGAAALEKGVAAGQLEAMARRTPNERSLTVAFDVLTELSARGVPVDNALAQVQAKLDARASDAAIRSLSGSVTGTVGVGRGGNR